MTVREAQPESVEVHGIDQVLTNLISNAIKYGEGKPIEIKTSLQRDVAAISVRDQGPGIDKKMQKKIFERFERAVSSRNISGFGLGLFISKEILVSELGEGSEFRVELPLGPQESCTH